MRNKKISDRTMRFASNRSACIASLTLALSGCAFVGVAPSGVVMTKQTPPYYVMQAPKNTFSANGRFSAKRDTAQASGQFRYEQDGSKRVLEIFAPTGTPIARIDADASSAKVVMANGETRTASTLAELLQSFIDIRVTDAQFSAWMQATPLIDAKPERDPQGRIERFRESAWMIEVGARAEGDTGYVRRMRWAYTPEIDTEIRWVIDEFSAP
jgi:outer membrane biogenesis lipoprotein LolB